MGRTSRSAAPASAELVRHEKHAGRWLAGPLLCRVDENRLRRLISPVHLTILSRPRVTPRVSAEAARNQATFSNGFVRKMRPMAATMARPRTRCMAPTAAGMRARIHANHAGIHSAAPMRMRPMHEVKLRRASSGRPAPGARQHSRCVLIHAHVHASFLVTLAGIDSYETRHAVLPLSV